MPKVFEDSEILFLGAQILLTAFRDQSLFCPEHGGDPRALLQWRTMIHPNETAMFWCCGGHYIQLEGLRTPLLSRCLAPAIDKEAHVH